MTVAAPSKAPSKALIALSLLVGSPACAISIVPEGTVRHIDGARDRALDPERVRVLVWNVYKSSLPSWWEDFAPLMGRHDVALLQEGWWDAELERGYAGLAFDWWMGVTFVSNWADGDPLTGTVIGGRSPVRGATSRHSRYLEPVIGTPKSHCFGRFALAGHDDELLAVSVHSINFRLGLTAFGDQLRLVMQDADNHDGPAIVAGDFNTWSEERTALLFDEMARARFRSVYPRSPEEAPHDGRTDSSEHYLDHAFVRDLAVRGEPRVLTAIESSDHEALSFVVAVE